MGNFNGGNRSFGRNFRGRSNFDRGGRGDRQMFKAVCSNCGKDCQVPFRPTGDKPVYCSDCFGKMGDRGERRSFDRPNPSYKAQFEEVNAKLNQILNLLQPKPDVELPQKTEAVVETSVEEAEAKPAKPKKPVKDKAPKKSE